MTTADQNRQIDTIRTQYTDIYGSMTWLTEQGAVEAEAERRRLLSEMSRHPQARWDFSDTKLIARELSPGCRLCGQGKWSCLFINNICNARCFYCPAPQKDLGQPATGRLEFSKPEDYADYVEAFDIQGVSFSGGEPLISFEKIMTFLTVLRQRITRPLYIWMYTNGLLASREKFTALAHAGLDEIRFDLSANAYHLDGLRKAVGVIPVVTVEIPAIPEDVARVKPLLAQLVSEGVDFLNLHQIRCTKFNSEKLNGRGYTFVHGQGITVLETELAALELIRHTLERQIPLPVNYCAFTYRHQFQRSGAQARNAVHAKALHESITRTGLIRTTTLTGAPGALDRTLAFLTAKDADPALWELSSNQDRLHLHADLLKELPPDGLGGLHLKILHSGTTLEPSVSCRHRYKEIPLNPDKTVVVERFPRHRGVVLSGDQIPEYTARYLAGNDAQLSGQSGLPLEQLDPFETFISGLSPYF